MTTIDETTGQAPSTSIPLLGAKSSRLVSAEWRATVEGRDEMATTQMLILARSNPANSEDRKPWTYSSRTWSRRGTFQALDTDRT